MENDILTAGRRRFWYRRALSEIKRAAVVITDSHHVATDVKALLGVSEEKVVVVRPSPHGMLRICDHTLDVALGTREPFVLAFGGRAPSKNMVLLQEVARLLEGRFSWPVLVMVGADVGAQRWSSAVEVMGRVTDAELGSLMRVAKGVVVPSLWEGFGYPVVEAMTVGTPVLTLDAAWSAELVSDPSCRLKNRPDVWVEAIADLLTGGGRIAPAALPDWMRSRGSVEFAKDIVSAVKSLGE
jgi:glycosyltransferase involved in cell wall biosynthesis